MAMWQGWPFRRRARKSHPFDQSVSSLDIVTQAWQSSGPGYCPFHPTVPLFQSVQKGDYYCPLCRAERERNTDPLQSLRPFDHWRALHPSVDKRATEMLPTVRKGKRL